MADFGSNLKRIRLAAGLTQAQLSEKSGVSTGTIGNYEAGHRARVSYEIADRLANALGVGLEDFGFNRRTDIEINLSEQIQGQSKIIIPKGALTKLEESLLQSFRLLNDLGQEEAIKRVGELSELTRYCKKG